MSADKIEVELTHGVQDLEIQDEEKDMKPTSMGVEEEAYHHADCAICWNKIELQEAALIKGCEHAYCVTCILRWASIRAEQDKELTCPMCKNRFKFLNIHRALDGRIHDYMHEESVCLLLRASWFNPLVVVEREEVDEETEDSYFDEGDPDEFYLDRSSSVRIGNRRFGDNGYVQAGRQEARPAYRPNLQDYGAAGSSQHPKKKVLGSKGTVGRRAKRTLKREAAAAKQQQNAEKLGNGRLET